MEFDSDGILTPESLFLFEQIQRQGEIASVAHEHNMSVAHVAAMSESIMRHCLNAISLNRDLLVLENALNVSIRRFLKDSGYTIRSGDAGSDDYLHSQTAEGGSVAKKVPRRRANLHINSDLIVDHDDKRVELKTSAFASPKNGVPDELFDKDLSHIQRQQFEDLETFPWEGVLRNDRAAELALFACDKIVARRSKRLQALVGDISSPARISVAGHDGATYVVETGQYVQTEQLHVQRARPFVIKDFIVFMALPSRRE
jgi:hypothetical protein